MVYTEEKFKWNEGVVMISKEGEHVIGTQYHIKRKAFYTVIGPDKIKRRISQKRIEGLISKGVWRIK